MMYFKRWLSFGAGMLCAVLSLPASANPVGGHASGGMRSMPAQMQIEMSRQFEPAVRRVQSAPIPQPAFRVPRFFTIGALNPWLFSSSRSRFTLACTDRPAYGSVASSALVFGPPLIGQTMGSILATCDGSSNPLREEAPPATLVPAHNKNALYGRGYSPDAQTLK